MTIGTRVIDRHGEHGVVHRFYDDFSAIAASCCSMSGDEWFERQMPPLAEECKKEQWVSVKLDTGGSIWTPKTALELEVVD